MSIVELLYTVLSYLVEKGTHEKTLELIRKEGFSRARIDGEIYDMDDDIELDKNKKHNIEIIVDRIKLREDVRGRLFSSLETALKFGDGKVVVSINDIEQVFSEHLSCPYCDFFGPSFRTKIIFI